jgi:hypothetical protein
MHSMTVPESFRYQPIWRDSRNQPRMFRESPWRNGRNASDWLFDSHSFDKDGQRVAIARGYIDYYDVKQLRAHVAPRRLRTFTLLRDPVERFLSFVAFTDSNLEQVLGLLEEFQGFELDKSHVNRSFDGALSDASLDYADFLLNGVANQFGGTLFRSKAKLFSLDYRARLVDDAALLRRAKQTLDQCEFVGFYEHLAYDFGRLRDTLLRNVYIPFHFPWLFWLGALIATPRTLVRKFAERESSATLTRVRRLVALDQQLFDYAVAKHRPSLRLYNSYAEFALAYAPHAIVALALIALILFECKRRPIEKFSSN